MKKILVGTTKGLVVFTSSEKSLETVGIYFSGFSINMVFVDERSNKWWVGISHKHWGQKLHVSDDEGKSWSERSVPNYHGYYFLGGKNAMLKQLWCMQHGGKDNPELLWLGTEPGGLFRSEDGGQSFHLVESLWNHPSRMKEGQWFGTGSDHPFIHSIEVNPSDSDHIFVAISSAGVFESKDGGSSWDSRNRGLVATYLPNPQAEVGHDPHILLMHPLNHKVLWQQNHCGVFLSQNRGLTWQNVSAKEGLPSYGFAMAIDDQDPAKAWVIPVESDEQRVAPDLSLQVFETNDFGTSWQSVSVELPANNAFDIVLRQSFIKSEDLFVFGTTNGNLYYTSGDKIKWQLASSNLTKVNYVRVSICK